MKAMKVLVIGSLEPAEAEKYRALCQRAGEEIAGRGHIMVAGGGAGVPGSVAGFYKSSGGKRYVAYYPSKSKMKAAGEEPGQKPDRTVWTGLDYPERNIKMIKSCDAVLALPGGLGTLTEIINAAKDYGKRVCVADAGELPKIVGHIAALKGRLLITNDFAKALDYLESRE